MDGASRVVADVQMAHRRDLGGARQTVTELFEELAAKRFSEDDVKALVAAAGAVKEMDADEALKTFEALMKSLDLGNRAAIAQKLSQSLTSLIDSERTAFNIDDRTRGANEIVEGLKRLAAMPVD